MTKESEKRFHAIMDKLFHAPPKSKSNSSTKSTSLSGVQASRGKKRSNMTSTLAGDGVEELQISLVSGGTVQAPICRPWDRGDLLKRLATFKSMTWFAKPEVVSAVNCARRGWVNVDSDIIACEACGARLLFSTPSSWTHHQVEKAALVFSLKLDNGHKLFCPWGDNACDEMLAQFPPMSAAVLVDNYKKRCSVLLQLLALPVISSSAIDYMRSPQLDHFLKGSSTIEFGNKSADASTTEYLGNEFEAGSSVLYYQAQKIISLCGWEPRSLPYTVNCKDLSIKDADLSVPLHVISNGESPSINVSSSAIDENTEAIDDPMTSGLQYDPSSVVLDCRLCGASIGLWAFSTVPRPVEFIRLVGFSEVNGENEAARHKVHTDAGASRSHGSSNGNHVESKEPSTNNATTGTSSLNELPLKLNLTIAGGPPPAKQNFRPTISLPVIGRNLRARFSSDSEFRDNQCIKNSLQGGKDHNESTLTGQEFELDMGLAQGKSHDGEHYNSTSNDLLFCLGSEISEHGHTLRNDCNRCMPMQGTHISEQEIPETCTPEPFMGNPLENTAVVHSSSKLDKLPENAASVGTADPALGDLCTFQVGNSSSMTTPGGHFSIGNGEASISDTLLMIVADNCHLQQNPGTDTICGKRGDSDGHGVVARVQPVNNNIMPYSIGKDLKQPPLVKSMKFDPIRQHRHFCPWIASSSNSAPGWQQTLSALQRQEEFSSPLSTNGPSSSIIEVDDPVASVKKLFMSPSAKRKKFAHG